MHLAHVWVGNKDPLFAEVQCQMSVMLALGLSGIRREAACEVARPACSLLPPAHRPPCLPSSRGSRTALCPSTSRDHCSSLPFSTSKLKWLESFLKETGLLSVKYIGKSVLLGSHLWHLYLETWIVFFLNHLDSCLCSSSACVMWLTDTVVSRQLFHISRWWLTCVIQKEAWQCYTR